MHSKFVQMFYGKRWDDESQFGLIINTGSLAPELAADKIVEAVRALDQNGYPTDATTTAKIEVDPVLADAISKVMAYPLPELPA